MESIEAALDRPPQAAMVLPALRRGAGVGRLRPWAIGISARPAKTTLGGGASGWFLRRVSHISERAVSRWGSGFRRIRSRGRASRWATSERSRYEPNTRLRLAAARPDEHRLTLAQGDISAPFRLRRGCFSSILPPARRSIWGVPTRCMWTIRAPALLRVTLGWVSLEWEGRESMVPAGAQCRTRPKIGPGTPYFDDASEKLQAALARFDFENGAAWIRFWLSRACGTRSRYGICFRASMPTSGRACSIA